MTTAFNPDGLTLADLVRTAEVFEARASKLSELLESADGDENKKFLQGLLEENQQQAQRARAIAQALGDTDPPTTTS